MQSDQERLAALRKGAYSKPAGYLSIDVSDFRWLVDRVECPCENPQPEELIGDEDVQG